MQYSVEAVTSRVYWAGSSFMVLKSLKSSQMALQLLSSVLFFFSLGALITHIIPAETESVTMEEGIPWESNSWSPVSHGWSVVCLLEGFSLHLGYFCALYLLKVTVSGRFVVAIQFLLILTWRLLQGDNSSEHARFWHYYLFFQFLSC